MKLFMRSFYDNPDRPREMKDPMDYDLICLGCAAMLGGKMVERNSVSMHQAQCGFCKDDKPVSRPRDYIWRR